MWAPGMYEVYGATHPIFLLKIGYFYVKITNIKIQTKKNGGIKHE